MSDMPRTKNGKSVGISIAVGLVSLYVLSFGPAFWIASRLADPGRTLGTLSQVYRPVVAVSLSSPRIVQAPLEWYLNLAAPEDVFIAFFTGDDLILLSEHPGFTFTWLSCGSRRRIAEP